MIMEQARTCGANRMIKRSEYCGFEHDLIHGKFQRGQLTKRPEYRKIDQCTAIYFVFHCQFNSLKSEILANMMVLGCDINVVSFNTHIIMVCYKNFYLFYIQLTYFIFTIYLLLQSDNLEYLLFYYILNMDFTFPSIIIFYYTTLQRFRRFDFREDLHNVEVIFKAVSRDHDRLLIVFLFCKFRVYRMR